MERLGATGAQVVSTGKAVSGTVADLDEGSRCNDMILNR